MVENKSQIKLCECGCGLPAPISKGTNKKRGYKKGKPTRFISGHNPHLVGSGHPNWTGGKVETPCAQCGKKTFRKPSIVKKTKLSFCCKECRGKYLSIHTSGKNSPIFGDKNSNWDGGKIEIACSQCGKPVYRHKTRMQRAEHFFCNDECCHAWQAINWNGKDHPAYRGGTKEIACDQCGKMFKKKPNKIKKDDHHFCSRKCMGAWYSLNLRGEKHPSYKSGYTQIHCTQCGKEVNRRPSTVEDGKNYFCSRKCASGWRTINLCGENSPNWKGGLTKLVCKQCGKEIKKKPSQATRAKNNFCSPKCNGLWKSTNLLGENSHSWKGGSAKVVCCQCGKEFEKTHASIRQSKKHFCSHNCKYIWQSINQCGENNPMWNGGISLGIYCSTWTDKEFKAYIFERDEHKCQNPDCWHTGKFLTRHHINYKKKDCDPSNIITVCNSCNVRANTNRDWHKSYYQAIMEKRINKSKEV